MQFKLEGLDILKQPHIVWQSSNLTKKRVIFNLVFENNLKVVKGRIGTAQYSLPYRLMSNKRIPKNRLVEQIQNNWKQLAPYFKQLHYVFEE